MTLSYRSFQGIAQTVLQNEGHHNLFRKLLIVIQNIQHCHLHLNDLSLDEISAVQADSSSDSIYFTLFQYSSTTIPFGKTPFVVSLSLSILNL